MKIQKSYIYKKDGIIGIACGYEPKGVEVVETKLILMAEGDCKLFKDDENVGGEVIIADESEKDLYTEKEIEIEETSDEEPEEK